MDKATLDRLTHTVNQHVRLHSKVTVSSTYMGIEVGEVESLVNKILLQLESKPVILVDDAEGRN